MSCNKCPHYVRHGCYDKEEGAIVFKNLCGLRHKQFQEEDGSARKQKVRGRGKPIQECWRRRDPLPKGTSLECAHFPFSQAFDYVGCAIYQDYFAGAGMRNTVIPTKDFQYSEKIAGIAVTDMELL